MGHLQIRDCEIFVIAKTPAGRGRLMPPDTETPRKAKMKPIGEIAAGLGIPDEALEPYGRTKAKIAMDWINQQQDREDGKLILVTAINPTPAGEGKTTTSVGLSDGLNRIGKNAAVCLREPSLGPSFGMKGGAAGGGFAQVVPMEDINLHFTGDFHAITSAHNLLSAMIDNHIYWGNAQNIDTRRIVWRRVLDMNDRSLRQIVNSLGGVANGYPRETGFDITVASEIMAILCLATSIEDLEESIGNIIVGYRRDKSAVTARDINAHGAMTVLLKSAIQPNLVQTLENNPAFIHGGPFANIAHGCNSVTATQTALKLADYVVTEAGFGAENVDAVKKGVVNLLRHIENVRQFGVPAVVAINHFTADTEAEVQVIKDAVAAAGTEAFICTHWADGGAGTEELARKVVEIVESGASQFAPLYPADMPLFEKINTIATRIYRADEAIANKSVRNQLKAWEQAGFGNLPVCMA